jgi:diguanylate cyclase (GGDEF)-like protein
MVLPETNLDGALHVAQRLRQKVEKTRFFAGSPDKVVQLTISMGIAMFGEDAQTKPELIQCADTALYLAKSRGRNQVVLCSEVDRASERN